MHRLAEDLDLCKSVARGAFPLIFDHALLQKILAIELGTVEYPLSGKAPLSLFVEQLPGEFTAFLWPIIC
jgi:hypothetical protein